MTRKPKSLKKAKAPVKANQAAKYKASIAASPAKTIANRVAALAQSPLAVCENDTNLQATLDLLRNQAEPIEVRLAALQALQAASFSFVAFEACRSEYTAALREVAQDPDPELRQRALGMLARDKDGFAQQKLLEGLRNPDKALVPPEKALQLLSYDVHSEAYPTARAMVRKPPNAMARREALRLLAADTGSAGVFEKILLDKSEAADIRQIAAAALNALKPEKLQAHAREIVLDESEADDIQSTCLTALTQFGHAPSIAQDKVLRAKVENLRGKASNAVKQTARQFLDKYSQ